MGKYYGMGRVGEGVYLLWDGPRKTGKISKAYRKWTNMLERVYSEKYQDRRPAYKGCSIVEEWLDYQVFAEWFYAQHQYLPDLQLDKDILKEGNKVYGPDTCCLVPQKINQLTSRNGRSAGGKFPVGVSIRLGKYRAQIKYDGVHYALGTYKTPMEAFLRYKEAKELRIAEVVREYEKVLPKEVTLALLRYEVKITD